MNCFVLPGLRNWNGENYLSSAVAICLCSNGLGDSSSFQFAQCSTTTKGSPAWNSLVAPVVATTSCRTITSTSHQTPCALVEKKQTVRKRLPENRTSREENRTRFQRDCPTLERKTKSDNELSGVLNSTKQFESDVQK